jgi:hypothetical protein
MYCQSCLSGRFWKFRVKLDARPLRQKCLTGLKIITIKTIFEIIPFDYFPQIVLIDAHHSRQIYGNIFDNTPVLRKTSLKHLFFRKFDQRAKKQFPLFFSPNNDLNFAILWENIFNIKHFLTINFQKDIEIFLKCLKWENVFCPCARTVNNLAIVYNPISGNIVANRLILLKFWYSKKIFQIF